MASFISVTINLVSVLDSGLGFLSSLLTQPLWEYMISKPLPNNKA